MNVTEKISCLSVLIGMLCSCTTGTPELAGLSPKAQAEIIKNYGGVYKVGKPYKIAGRWYYPQEDYTYSEVGVASWYGEDFNGKMTANGERYDMNTLTAAHRTLPLPSIVKVTNLQNGRAVVLRVNDRGPYVKDRIIDLSKRGAQLLGYIGQGTTRVKVEVMAKESQALKAAMLNQPFDENIKLADSTTAAHSLYETSAERIAVSEQMAKNSVVYGSAVGADGERKSGALGYYSEENIPTDNGIYAVAAQNPNKVGSADVLASSYQYVVGSYYVQAGSFSQYDLAHKLKVRLQEYADSHIINAKVNGKDFYRVALGPYKRVEEAKVTQAKLKYYGIKDTRIEQK